MLCVIWSTMCGTGTHHGREAVGHLCVDTHTHTHAHTHTRTHAHTNESTHTHTHTHYPSPPALIAEAVLHQLHGQTLTHTHTHTSTHNTSPPARCPGSSCTSCMDKPSLTHTHKHTIPSHLHVFPEAVLYQLHGLEVEVGLPHPLHQT